MDTTRLQQARRLFNSEFIDRQANRRNMRQWIYSLRMLGDKWLLAKQEAPKPWKETMVYTSKRANWDEPAGYVIRRVV